MHIISDFDVWTMRTPINTPRHIQGRGAVLHTGSGIMSGMEDLVFWFLPAFLSNWTLKWGNRQTWRTQWNPGSSGIHTLSWTACNRLWPPCHARRRGEEKEGGRRPGAGVVFVVVPPVRYWHNGVLMKWSSRDVRITTHSRPREPVLL